MSNYRVEFPLLEETEGKFEKEGVSAEGARDGIEFVGGNEGEPKGVSEWALEFVGDKVGKVEFPQDSVST